MDTPVMQAMLTPKPEGGAGRVTAADLEGATLSFCDGSPAMGDGPVIHLGGVLGTGAYGVIYEGYLGGFPYDALAVKVYRERGVCDTTHLLREVEALKAVGDHAHLVTFLGFVEGRLPPVHKGMTGAIVTRRLEGSDLFNTITNPEMQARVREPWFLLALLSQVAAALAHIHAKGFFHGDVKCENVMVDADVEAKAVTCTLLDFDRAERLHTDGKSWVFTAGTVAYTSPEAASRSRLGPAHDMYCLGVAAYLASFAVHPTTPGLCTGAAPEDSVCKDVLQVAPALLEKVKHPVARSVMAGLLAKDPRRRLTAAQVVAACAEAAPPNGDKASPLK